MSGFRAEVDAATQRPVGDRFTQVCSALSDEDREEFLDALHDPLVPCQVLEKVLKGRGIKVSDASIRKWRAEGRTL